MPIDTYENGGVCFNRYEMWVDIVEVEGDEINFIVGDYVNVDITIPEAEALVRHLRRAIRRQKARAAQ